MKPCCLCGHDTPTVLFTKQQYDIVRCPVCGLKYLDLEPNPDFFETLYAEDYFQNEDAAHGYGDYMAGEEHLKKTFAARMKRIETFRAGGGALLDIGCGPGFFLEVLPPEWAGRGVDVSAFACAIARSRGHDVAHGLFHARDFVPESFDAVTLWNAIEHVADPVQTLRHAHAILKPGGVIGIYTGNADSLFARITGRAWHLYLTPEHLTFFSRKTLGAMLARCGFEMLFCHSENLYFSGQYLLERAGKALGLWPHMKGRLRRGSFLERIIIPVNFLDTVTCYARKPG